jgi:hypothetical protein
MGNHFGSTVQWTVEVTDKESEAFHIRKVQWTVKVD